MHALATVKSHGPLNHNILSCGRILTQMKLKGTFFYLKRKSYLDLSRDEGGGGILVPTPFEPRLVVMKFNCQVVTHI